MITLVYSGLSDPKIDTTSAVSPVCNYHAPVCALDGGVDNICFSPEILRAWAEAV